jgi:calcium-activated chloride channel regulator 4
LFLFYFLVNSIPTRPKTTQPEFSYRKYGTNYVGKYVLVLDISASMNNSRLSSLNYAARTFIKDIPLNNYMAIVIFSTDASVTQHLVQITDDNVRQKLIQAVPTSANGQTAIGKGLVSALEELEASGKGVEGSNIVLVTDGQENVDPKIITVMPRILEAKVHVNCLAIGPDASVVLENLTKQTGGRMDRVSDGVNQAIKIETVFSSFAGCEDDDQSVAVFDKMIDIDQTVTDKEVIIKVDNQLGKNNVITISLDMNYQDQFAKLKISVVAPDGFNYVCGGHSDFVKDESLKRCQLKLATSKNGNFKVHINREANGQKIQINIKMSSQAKDPNDPPVIVNAWLSKIEIDHSKDQPTIFVQIKKGSFPVIKADVYAIIENEKGTQFRIRVKDSGNFDGIYIAKFNKADSNGRYSISVKVIYTNDTRVVISGRKDFRPGTPKISDHPRTDKPKTNFNPDEFKFNPKKPIIPPKYENLTDFVRVKVVGSIKVDNYTQNYVVPPEKVIDLKV